MSTFFNALGQYSGTFGTTINGEVQKVALLRQGAEVRVGRWNASLDGPNIPVSVYTRLVDGVNRNLPTFHRYLKLRKKMMGVDAAALLRSVRAAGRLGEPGVHAGGGARSTCSPRSRRSAPSTRPSSSARSTSGGSTCCRPTGKHSGAYSNGGAYDVHPYMLINYNGKYTDVSTVAHEMGHTMQSYFSNKTQPYPLASVSDLRRRGRLDVQRERC